MGARQRLSLPLTVSKDIMPGNGLTLCQVRVEPFFFHPITLRLAWDFIEGLRYACLLALPVVLRRPVSG